MSAGLHYAPHPGAMSDDLWPSFDDLEHELRSRRRTSSMSFDSPYDNKFEAASGAAALINAPSRYGNVNAATAAYGPGARAAAVGAAAFPRKASLPNRPPPTMAPWPAARQWSDQWDKRGSRQPPLSPLSAHFGPPIESPPLPSVVLTPPDDEPGDPVSLYPRLSPDGVPIAAPIRTIIDAEPLVLPQASEPLPEEPAPPIVVRGGFQTKPPPAVSAPKATEAASVIMPMREQQQRDGGFDADFDNMMRDHPSGPAPRSSKRDTPLNHAVIQMLKEGPPEAPQSPSTDRSAARKSLPANQTSPTSANNKRQTLPARAPETGKAVPPVPAVPSHPRQASEPSAKPAPTDKQQQRRRTRSLSTLFSKRKSRGADEAPPVPTDAAPPVPPLPATLPSSPGLASAAASPAAKSPADKKQKRRTLMGQRSLKDLFSLSKSQEGNGPPQAARVRKSKSKPELHTHTAPADAPPVPPMPARVPSPAPPTVVPDALAALTARSSPPKPTAAQQAQSPVEFVPDLFAAFGSGNTAVNMDTLERARAGAPPPAPPVPAGPPPVSPPSISAAQKASLAKLQADLREDTSSAPTPSQPATPKSTKPEKDDRRKSLSKRISLPSLFKKKKPAEVPNVPAIPAKFERVTAAPAPAAKQASQSGSLPRNGSKGVSSAPTGQKAASGPEAARPAAATVTPPTRTTSSRPPLPLQLVQEAMSQQKPATRSRPTTQQPHQPASQDVQQHPTPQAQAQPQSQVQQKLPLHPPLQLQMPEPSVRLSASEAPRPLRLSQQVVPARDTPAQFQPALFTQPAYTMPQPYVGGRPASHQAPPQPHRQQDMYTIVSPTKPLNIQKRVPVPPVSPTSPTLASKAPFAIERKEVPAADDPAADERMVASTTAAPAVASPTASYAPVVAASAVAAVADAGATMATALPAPATTPAPVVPTIVIQSKQDSPSSDSVDLPSEDAPVIMPRPVSEAMATLAYLEGGSDDSHTSMSNDRNMSTSTIMPSFEVTPTESPDATVRGAPKELDLVADSPQPGAASQTSDSSGLPSEPPSPSPSHASVAEVHTAQTARRSQFRSLSTMEILALGDQDETLAVTDLRNVVTEGENQGVQAAAAALGGAAVGAIGVGAVAATTDAPEPAPAENLFESEPEVKADDKAKATVAVKEVAPEQTAASLGSPILVAKDDLPASVDSCTETATITAEPEEMDDDIPQGWVTFDPDKTVTEHDTQAIAAVAAVPKAASDDSHVPIARVAPVVPGSAPATLSRVSGIAQSSQAARPPSSVMETVAGTSIGLQPPKPSIIDEALEDAQTAIESAGSYFASAANRMSRLATGIATTMSTALSPSSSNVDLAAIGSSHEADQALNETDQAVSASSATPPVPRSPQSPLVELYGTPRTRTSTMDSTTRPQLFTSPSSASVTSTNTFDTAHEFGSAEEGSLDSATFETFETYSTSSARTYTPAIPPPQSSVPNLLDGVQQPQPSRARRGSMPAVLASTAARRRPSLTPLGYQAPRSPHQAPSILSRLDAGSPAMDEPVRRPYTGRSVTNPESPTRGDLSPFAPRVDIDNRRDSFSARKVFPGSSDMRPDSPLDLQMPGTFMNFDNSSFVVPFSPDEPAASATRSPTTVSGYTPTAGARQHTRRDSGITSAMGGLGFARKGPIESVDGVQVSHAVVGISPVQHERRVVRNSVMTSVVDYSARSSMAPEFALWPEGAAVEVSEPEGIEVSEPECVSGSGSRPGSSVETGHEESFQLDSSSCDSSSASDELDGAPCTPKTPDLESLSSRRDTPSPEDTTGTVSAGSTRDNTPSKAAGTARLARAPFRPMHYDMSQESSGADDSYTTANEMPV